MNGYWTQHPPMHLLLAAYVGFKPPGAETRNDPAELEKLARLLGG